MVLHLLVGMGKQERVLLTPKDRKDRTMSDKTGISWTDATWSPLVGCTKVSAGCDNCYAMVNLLADRLDQPLRWRKPRRIFVNAQSDLFHKDVPDDFIVRVWAVMTLAPQHVFQVLTKRHARMRSLLSAPRFQDDVWRAATVLMGEHGIDKGRHFAWPLPGVWLGVSVEDQSTADLRIPALLDTPAAVRWISAEPLLGPVDLSRWLAPKGVDGFLSKASLVGHDRTATFSQRVDEIRAAGRELDDGAQHHAWPETERTGR